MKIIVVAVAIFGGITLAYYLIWSKINQDNFMSKSNELSRREVYDLTKKGYKECLKRNPADICTLRNYAGTSLVYGRSLSKAGKADEAEKKFSKALKLSKKVLELAPNDFHSSRYCGEVLCAQAKYDEVIAQFEKAFAINVFPAEIYVYQAAALAKIGKVDDAKTKLNQADAKTKLNQALVNFDDLEVKEKVTL